MRRQENVLCCCCCDKTLATRWIGFFGLALSTGLTTVLINDKLANNFQYSRNTALALGLDWQHIHEAADISHAADPNGKVISAIMVFYSVVYLLANMILIFASITENRWCTFPWLAFGFFSCLSKIAAIIYHQLKGHSQYNEIYYIGSAIFIIIEIWWLMVVYLAQREWATSAEISLVSPYKESISLSRIETLDELYLTGDESRFSYHPMSTQTFISQLSCEYIPNSHYGQI